MYYDVRIQVFNDLKCYYNCAKMQITNVFNRTKKRFVNHQHMRTTFPVAFLMCMAVMFCPVLKVLVKISSSSFLFAVQLPMHAVMKKSFPYVSVLLLFHSVSLLFFLI